MGALGLLPYNTPTSGPDDLSQLAGLRVIPWMCLYRYFLKFGLGREQIIHAELRASQPYRDALGCVCRIPGTTGMCNSIYEA